MVEKLRGKLSHARRCEITAEVRERNLPAQMFFRAMGFRCVNMLRNFYDDVDEDALVFSFRVYGRPRVE